MKSRSPKPARRSARPSSSASRLPPSDEPFWHRGPHPLANHQSAGRLPTEADVVVIGAGLVGASAAYHLRQAAKVGGARMVVIEQADPAGEASGRNGGNFELIPENSVGAYEGLARERLAFLETVYPTLPIEVMRAESERQASVVLGVALRNRELLKGIILRERIECDFSPRGWLHLACNEDEEQGLCEEVMLAAQHGQRIELWSRRKIRDEFGFGNDYLGRFIPGDGTYHPFKYVCGLLKLALDAGVQLFTRTRVVALESETPTVHDVVTERGTIRTGQVIVATNAFTSRLFPELDAIRPYQSQVMVTENAPDRARGRIVTCEDGPAFFNQPREGARNGTAPLLLGGGDDRPLDDPSSRKRSLDVHRQLMKIRDRFYPELRGQPAAAEWIGPMAFTPDQLPALGPLRPGIIIAMACNGYGGSYTTAAGLAAAEMALTGSVPDWIPEDVFSPRRLLSDEPIFMTERDSLWRIATSLSRQLKSVNRQIAEEMTLSREAPDAPVSVRPSRLMTRIVEAPSDEVVRPEMLTAFPTFRSFTLAELGTVLRAMRRWNLPTGTVLFTEGSPGGSCFIIVRGAVDVSIEVNGQHQLLAHLPAGSVFGQQSLIDGEPRSATCTIQRDAVLVELDRETAERLLDNRSPVALKLLGVLTDGLIEALRGADRRLMQLTTDGRRYAPGTAATT